MARVVPARIRPQTQAAAQTNARWAEKVMLIHACLDMLSSSIICTCL